MSLATLKTSILPTSFGAFAFKEEERQPYPPQPEKVAVIIWNMVVGGISYNPSTIYGFLKQKRKRKLQEMKTNHYV
ncbi:hypothetical protein [Segetibacter koreensis]|uniref:hypothetical protein n=1 Tax=Segetibacter koreensis TaxID=398037 RepID=UPI00037E96C2|nr:hypothetical protein [Segetibacter koreensis]